MRQGILIIDGDLSIKPNYSRYLYNIFPVEHLSGRNIYDVLIKNSNLMSDQKQLALTALQSIIGEEDYNYDANSCHLPSCVNYENRVLKLEWIPRSYRGIVKELILTIRDETQLEEIKQDAARSQEKIDILVELIKITEERYESFEKNGLRMLDQMITSLNNNLKTREEISKEICFNLHTIKGEARSLDFKHLCNQIHEAESVILDQHNSGAGISLTLIQEELVDIKEVMSDYQHLFDEKFRSRSTYKDGINHKKQVQDLIDLLGSNAFRSKAAQLQTYYPILYATTDEFVQSYETSLRQLARHLEKAVPKLKVLGENCYLSYEGRTLLEKVFIHLMRNSIDHGIESKLERGLASKPEQGSILVEFKRSSLRKLTILFRDDGRGLNLAKLLQKANELGHPIPDSIGNQDLAELIFIEEISTAEKVTDISGRGIGMSAIKKYLDQDGASIDIVLENIDGNQNYVNFYYEIVLTEDHFLPIPKEQLEQKRTA